MSKKIYMKGVKKNLYSTFKNVIWHISGTFIHSYMNKFMFFLCIFIMITVDGLCCTILKIMLNIIEKRVYQINEKYATDDRIYEQVLPYLLL